MIFTKKNTFTSGELSPRLSARTDFAKYDNGVSTMLNCYAQPHGGVTKRAGTVFVNEVKDSSKEVRLVRFEFSNTQTYIMEFGNLYVRIYKDQTRIEGSGSITAITKANPGEVTRTGHGLATGDTITHENIVGMTQLNDVNVTITKVDANKYTVGVDTSGYGAWSSGGDSVVEITTTYTEAELPALSFTQSADTLYIAHVEHAPAKITRTSHTTWALANLSFTDAPAAWGASDYPKFNTFIQNRLVYSANASEPQTLWFSKIGEYLVFTAGTDDDDPITTALVSETVNAITWMKTVRDKLFVGTTGGEWTLTGDSNKGFIFGTLKQLRESTHGSNTIDPLAIENKTLFIQRQGNSVREFRYDLESDSFQAPELSILAEHLTRDNSISAWAYAEEPSSIVWAIRDDGDLLGMTYKRDQDVVGWHHHETDNGAFESVEVISGTDRDEVWVVVNRTIDGGTVRYVELMGADYSPGTDTDAINAIFLDSNLSYSGAATDTLTGLDHLEGEDVVAVADGKVHPAVTVASGSITLTYEASVVHVGIGYNSDIETLPIEVDDTMGSSSGRTRRISRVAIKLLETIGLNAGKDSSNLEYIPFNQGLGYGVAAELFTGVKTLDFAEGNELESTIFIRSDQPLPMTILSIATEIEINER